MNNLNQKVIQSPEVKTAIIVIAKCIHCNKLRPVYHSITFKSTGKVITICSDCF